MKSYITVILLTVCFVSEALATAQCSDIIVLAGEKYSLNSNPLEAFFAKYPERRPQGGVVSTALWRGYVATFEVRGEHLVVADIEIEKSEKKSNGKDTTVWQSVLEDVFPDTSERVCSYCSELLIIPMGEMISYVHMGYSSQHERYKLLLVQAGIVQKSRDFTGSEYQAFKRRQFEAYQKTDEYRREVESLKKKFTDASLVEKFLYEYDVDYTSRFLLDEL
jgi:hypothetical protein